MTRRKHFADTARALVAVLLVVCLASCDEEEKKDAPVDPGPLPPGTLPEVRSAAMAHWPTTIGGWAGGSG